MNPNNWNQYKLTQARSWPDLITKLETEITEPTEVLAMGFFQSGVPYCISRPKLEHTPRRRAARPEPAASEIHISPAAPDNDGEFTL